MRLLVDPAGSGPWNMALDEVLLERGEPVLRVYGWRPATLSLGYFQSAAERRSHPASASIECVRRLSGGGAIVHDHDVTYALVLPASDPRVRDTAGLYRWIHATWIEWLDRQGVHARQCVADEATSGPEPFLCFERRSVGDILLGEHKILGSAQRRRRGAVLQHGSLLVGRSSAAPELPGLTELASGAWSFEAIAQGWLDVLAASVGWTWERSSVTVDEQAEAERLVREKFSAEAWNQRR